MIIYEVGVSTPCWRGGEYNGSWGSEFCNYQFSTKEKAEFFIQNHKNPREYGNPPQFYGPFKKEIE